jgi:hypothetical protein
MDRGDECVAEMLQRANAHDSLKQAEGYLGSRQLYSDRL